MRTQRFLKTGLALGLFNATLWLCAIEDATANERQEQAKQYMEQLRKATDAKTKIKALQGLGELGQIKKSLITEAIPDIYKATEDKDAAVRAAAAETLGKADEPYSKAGPILVKMLKEEKDEAVKIGALRGLMALGPAAKESAPAIREIMKATMGDKKSKLGLAAKDALKAIGVGKR